MTVVVATGILSFSRIMALWNYYHAPMTVLFALETVELPRLLNSTGLLPTYPHNTPVEEIPRIDLSPIKHFDLKLCVGKEWHRFSGSYLVPEGITVEFIKSEFNGNLPGHFKDIPGQLSTPSWWLRPGTSYIPEHQNDLNREEMSRYVRGLSPNNLFKTNIAFKVPVETCDYLIDLDFPLHPQFSPLEPRYAVDDKTWERVFCKPFIDVRHSRLLTRAFWVPGKTWQSNNEFGDYCFLKNKALVGEKEIEVARRVTDGSL